MTTVQHDQPNSDHMLDMDEDTITILVVADLHDKVYTQAEKERMRAWDPDLLLFGGDFSGQPSFLSPSVERQLSSVNHIKSLPGKIKVAIPGNHCHLVEEAFDFRRYAPSARSDQVGSQRGRLTTKEAEQIRQAYETNEVEGWHFVQHGLVKLKNMKGDHALKIFGSGLSEFRNTDGNACVEEEVKDTDVWDEITDDVDIVLTHNPPFCDMTKARVGQKSLDRDCAEWAPGWKSLADAIRKAKTPISTSGHNHGSHGCDHVSYDDAVSDTDLDHTTEGSRSTGLWINAAATVAGFSSLETMPNCDYGEADYRAPRMPWVVRYNMKTKQSTAMSLDTVETMPAPWAQGIHRMSASEGDTDASITAEFLDNTKVERTVTKDIAEAWCAEIAVVNEARRVEEEADSAVIYTDS